MKSAAIDIFSFVVEYSPSMVREFILKEGQNQDDVSSYSNVYWCNYTDKLKKSHWDYLSFGHYPLQQQQLAGWNRILMWLFLSVILCSSYNLSLNKIFLGCELLSFMFWNFKAVDKTIWKEKKKQGSFHPMMFPKWSIEKQSITFFCWHWAPIVCSDQSACWCMKNVCIISVQLKKNVVS